MIGDDECGTVGGMRIGSGNRSRRLEEAVYMLKDDTS
jgi:hypothetical protein